MGGSKTSDRKAAAVRENGKKGGAPKGNQNWKGSKKNQYSVRGAVVTGVHRRVK